MHACKLTYKHAEAKSLQILAGCFCNLSSILFLLFWPVPSFFLGARLCSCCRDQRVDAPSFQFVDREAADLSGILQADAKPMLQYLRSRSATGVRVLVRRPEHACPSTVAPVGVTPVKGGTEVLQCSFDMRSRFGANSPNSISAIQLQCAPMLLRSTKAAISWSC